MKQDGVEQEGTGEHFVLRKCRYLHLAVLAFSLAAGSGLAKSQTADDIATDATRRAQTIANTTPDAPWGCTVLLCLANPKGPTAVAQCVDPINRLWRELRRGRAFPSCPMARGPQGGAYAQLGTNFYDRCPEGTTEVPAGTVVFSTTVQTMASGQTFTAPGASTAAAPSSPPASTLLTSAPTSHTSSGTSPTTVPLSVSAGSDSILMGIGSGEGIGLPSDPAETPLKVCAGRVLGTTHVISADDDQIVPVLDRLVLLAPARSSAYIDVMIDAGDRRGYVPWSRVRY